MTNNFYLAQHKIKPDTYVQYVRFYGGQIILLEITNNVNDSCYVDDSFFRIATPEEQVRKELDNYGFELVEHPIYDGTNWRGYDRRKNRNKAEYQR